MVIELTRDRTLGLWYRDPHLGPISLMAVIRTLPIKCQTAYIYPVEQPSEIEILIPIIKGKETDLTKIPSY